MELTGAIRSPPAPSSKPGIAVKLGVRAFAVPLFHSSFNNLYLLCAHNHIHVSFNVMPEFKTAWRRARQRCLEPTGELVGISSFLSHYKSLLAQVKRKDLTYFKLKKVLMRKTSPCFYAAITFGTPEEQNRAMNYPPRGFFFSLPFVCLIVSLSVSRISVKLCGGGGRGRSRGRTHYFLEHIRLNSRGDPGFFFLKGVDLGGGMCWSKRPSGF